MTGNQRIADELPELDPADLVLKDVVPYVQDPFYIARILVEARKTGDEAGYVEELIRTSASDRKGDLRILMNRMTKWTA